MDEFIRTQLQPVESCAICMAPFDSEHVPVALPCKHIFGHECVIQWLQGGQGMTRHCPMCRGELFGAPHVDLWRRLGQEQQRIPALITTIGSRFCDWWRAVQGGAVPGSRSLINGVVVPAFAAITMTGDTDPFRRLHNHLRELRFEEDQNGAIYEDDSAYDDLYPLFRLSMIVSFVAVKFPPPLLENATFQALLWNASFCTGTWDGEPGWPELEEAISNPRYFSWLHFYTVILSREICKFRPEDLPTGPDGKKLQKDRDVISAGIPFGGQPSTDFQSMAIIVIDELWSYHMDRGKAPLSGSDEEELMVKRLWHMAAWRVAS